MKLRTEGEKVEVRIHEKIMSFSRVGKAKMHRVKQARYMFKRVPGLEEQAYALAICDSLVNLTGKTGEYNNNQDYYWSWVMEAYYIVLYLYVWRFHELKVF